MDTKFHVCDGNKPVQIYQEIQFLIISWAIAHVMTTKAVYM